MHEQLKDRIEHGFHREMYRSAGYFLNVPHNFCENGSLRNSRHNKGRLCVTRTLSMEQTALDAVERNISTSRDFLVVPLSLSSENYLFILKHVLPGLFHSVPQNVRRHMWFQHDDEDGKDFVLLFLLPLLPLSLDISGYGFLCSSQSR